MVVAPKVVKIPTPPEFYEIQSLWQSLLNKSMATTGLEQLTNLRNAFLIELIYESGLKVSDIEKMKMNFLKKTPTEYRLLVTPDKKEPFTIKVSLSLATTFEQYQSLLKQTKRKRPYPF